MSVIPAGRAGDDRAGARRAGRGHRDEYLGRLTSAWPSEIAARAQRESRSDLCYWLKRRLFPQKRVCARCKAETDALIEGLCSQCYWR
jgi:hypothetical protein